MGLLYKKITCGCIVASSTHGNCAGGIGFFIKCIDHKKQINYDDIIDHFQDECEKYNIDELITNHEWSLNYPSSK